jgi:hypothetical protein
MSDDNLAFNGVCPVCGERFTDPTSQELDVGESYDVKMCTLPKDEWPAPDEPQILFHLKDQ